MVLRLRWRKWVIPFLRSSQSSSKSSRLWLAQSQPITRDGHRYTTLKHAKCEKIWTQIKSILKKFVVFVKTNEICHTYKSQIHVWAYRYRPVSETSKYWGSWSCHSKSKQNISIKCSSIPSLEFLKHVCKKFEIGSLIRDKHDLCWKKSVDGFLKRFICVLGKIWNVHKTFVVWEINEINIK